MDDVLDVDLAVLIEVSLHLALAHIVGGLLCLVLGSLVTGLLVHLSRLGLRHRGVAVADVLVTALALSLSLLGLPGLLGELTSAVAAGGMVLVRTLLLGLLCGLLCRFL